MKITIVGTGFSGLTLAYYLSKFAKQTNKNITLELVDKKPNSGGLIGAETESALGPIESAANGVLNSVDFVEMCQELGVEIESTSLKAKNKYIFVKDAPRRFPFSLWEFVGLVLRFVFLLCGRLLRGQWKLGTAFKPRAYESVWNWGNRIGGPALVENLLNPAFKGVFAVGSDILSARLVFKTLSGGMARRSLIEKHPVAKKYHHSTVSPKKGMGFLIRALTQHLSKQENISFKFKQNYLHNRLSQTSDNRVVLCVDLSSMLSLMHTSEFVKSNINKYPLKMVDLCSATLFFDKSDSKPEGFGVLFADSQQHGVMGVVMNSVNFPDRYQCGSETYIFNDPAITALSDQDIVARLMNTRKILNPSSMAQVTESQVFRWPQSLPQYDQNLEHWVFEDIFHRIEKEENILLHGNYLGELSLSKILSRSKQLAHQIVLGETHDS